MSCYAFDSLSIFTSLRPFLLLTATGYLYQLIPINRDFIADFHSNECDHTFVVLSINAYSIFKKKSNQSVVSDQSCVMKKRKSETREENLQKMKSKTQNTSTALASKREGN